MSVSNACVCFLLLHSITSFRVHENDDWKVLLHAVLQRKPKHINMTSSWNMKCISPIMHRQKWAAKNQDCALFPKTHNNLNYVDDFASQINCGIYVSESIVIYLIFFSYFSWNDFSYYEMNQKAESIVHKEGRIMSVISRYW